MKFLINFLKWTKNTFYNQKNTLLKCLQVTLWKKWKISLLVYNQNQLHFLFMSLVTVLNLAAKSSCFNNIRWWEIQQCWISGPGRETGPYYVHPRLSNELYKTITWQSTATRIRINCPTSSQWCHWLTQNFHYSLSTSPQEHQPSKIFKLLFGSKI